MMRILLICLALGFSGVLALAADSPADSPAEKPAEKPAATNKPVAREMPHSEQGLRPIGDSLAGLDLRALEALPVQHGGRYKAFHAFALETLDGINGRSSFGDGHTATSSLLDLLFCRSAYDQRPVVVVKHSELRLDLAPALPPNERERLVRTGLLSPARLAEPGVQAALDMLGRQTTKTKALNQIHRARAALDPGTLMSGLKFLPLPAGPHSDHWRNPLEAAPDFSIVLENFLSTAVAAQGGLEPYTRLTWSLLPLAPETAQRLGLEESELQRLNLSVLWPIWKAAGSGKLAPTAANQLLSEATVPLSASGLTGAESTTVAAGLLRLASRWNRLQIPPEDLAVPGDRQAIERALNEASLAWNALGSAWADVRKPGATTEATTRVQAHLNTLVGAVAGLRTLLDHDRAAQELAPLITDTALEMTYWRWNGFSGVAWCFLLAVPGLALGAIGGLRLPLFLGYALAAVGLGGQITAFFIRGILAQRIPLANLYESMAAAALLCSLVALIGEIVLAIQARRAGKRSIHGALALGASLFGCIIVLSQAFLERHDINAFISPAMPILSEFWLRVHTSCIVASYGIIGLGGLMSAAYLLMRVRLPYDDERCLAWDRTTFAINALAAVVLWVGLTLGAVWAAVSWGRPWGWDPKEVFALLTWVVFIMLVHLRLAVGPRQRGVATAWASLAALLVMIFNWYWVNVQLSGLHSYA